MISTATITNRIATDTHEITDATAWRCLVLSERTSWSLSSYSASMRRTILLAAQLMNRAASRPPIIRRAIRRPRSRIQTPKSPRQKPVQRSAKSSASTVLFVIVCVAPTDSGFEESVDVSVQYRSGIADFVLGAQVLDHLVRVQYVGAHLVAPRAAAVTLQRIQLSTFF